MLPHDGLEVPRTGLDLVRWTVALPGATTLPTGSHRQIDEGVTSARLNIAEGNGRYSEVAHRRFLDSANDKGPDEGRDEDPAAASENVQTQVGANSRRRR
ncbi:MAG: hypothetical protein KJ072_11120 [Verrucomicrobia bacterium]|nr:hypothetical protein [Verrucomicrobiota bacterium]